jgi:hypothetical protein
MSMSEPIAILFSGYMAGVVFGSVMSVTLYKIILSKNGILPSANPAKPSPAQERMAQ